jgi:hypothetical protein
MKTITILLLAVVGVASCDRPKQEEGSGQPDPLTITAPLESKPSRHIVNANRMRNCIGATYTRWTETENAPTTPMTLLTAVSACAREHGTEAFQDWVSIHGSGLGTLLELVERQTGAEEGFVDRGRPAVG